MLLYVAFYIMAEFEWFAFKQREYTYNCFTAIR